MVSANLASGVFASAFVVEISKGSELDWKSFYKATAFYLLLVLGAAVFLLHRAIYNRETEIRNFMDVDFCTAYMRAKCLPEAAERYRRLIRDGNGGELKQAMDELRKVLK